MSITPENMGYMDFEVLDENYSRYIVADGSTLKVKIVVKKILRTAAVNPQGYPMAISLDSINAVTAIVPPNLKRKPSKERWNPAKDIGKEMKFEIQEEKWQSYMTTEGYKVTVKPVVVKIIKYEKYNLFGEPIYAATIQAITNIEKLSATV